MKKRLLFIISFLGIGVLFLGVGFFVTSQRKEEEKRASSMTIVTPSLAAVQVKQWDDQAGFAMEYPLSLTVNPHDEDQVNYAHVEFTDPSHEGSIVVWATDTTANDVTAWVRTEKTFSGASIVDTTLGGEPAKKIMVTAQSKKIITGAVYDDLLFTVEGNFIDASYWTPLYNAIVSSFVFTPLEEDTTLGEESMTNSQLESEETFDEEVIE